MNKYTRTPEETRKYIDAIQGITRMYPDAFWVLCANGGTDPEKKCIRYIATHEYKKESGYSFPVNDPNRQNELAQTIQSGGCMLLRPLTVGTVFIDLDKQPDDSEHQLRQLFGEPLSVLQSRSYHIRGSRHLVYRIDDSVRENAKHLAGAWKFPKDAKRRGELMLNTTAIYMHRNNPIILLRALSLPTDLTKTLSAEDLQSIRMAKFITSSSPDKIEKRPKEWFQKEFNKCLQIIRKAEEGEIHDTIRLQGWRITCLRNVISKDAMLESMSKALAWHHDQQGVQSRIHKVINEGIQQTTAIEVQDQEQQRNPNELVNQLYQQFGTRFFCYSTELWDVRNEEVVQKVTKEMLKDTIKYEFPTELPAKSLVVDKFFGKISADNRVANIVYLPFQKRFIKHFGALTPLLNASTARLPFLNLDNSPIKADPYDFENTEYYEWMKVAFGDAFPCFIEWLTRAYCSAWRKEPHKVWNRYTAIIGEATTGKTLLANILAHLFGQTQPADVTDYMMGRTEFNNELSNFFRLIDDPEQADTKSRNTLADRILRFTSGGSTTVNFKYGHKVEQSIPGIFMAIANPARKDRIMPSSDDDFLERVNLIKLNPEVKTLFNLDRNFANRAFEAIQSAPAFLINQWEALSDDAKYQRFGALQWLDEDLHLATMEEDNIPEIEEFIELVTQEAELPDTTGTGKFEEFQFINPDTKEEITAKRIAIQDIQDLLSDDAGNVPDQFPRRKNGKPYSKTGLKKWMAKACARKRFHRWIYAERDLKGDNSSLSTNRNLYLVWQ